MNYILKWGILYEENSTKELAKIKSAISPEITIAGPKGRYSPPSPFVSFILRRISPHVNNPIANKTIVLDQYANLLVNQPAY
mgnify:CR=1 FL=1